MTSRKNYRPNESDVPEQPDGKLAPKLPAKLPALRTPKHGGGKLLTGGVPGHAGAGGRPKNAVRELCRDHLNDVLPRLHQQFLAGELSATDALRYADLLAKYGLGTQHENDLTVRAVQFTPEERAERVLQLVRSAEARANRTGGGAA